MAKPIASQRDGSRLSVASHNVAGAAIGSGGPPPKPSKSVTPAIREAPASLGDFALVLSAGGSLVSFEVGALRYLTTYYFPQQGTSPYPNLICGTSGGSINAAKLAEGVGALDDLERLWLTKLHNNADFYANERWLTQLLADKQADINNWNALKNALSPLTTIWDDITDPARLLNPDVLIPQLESLFEFAVTRLIPGAVGTVVQVASNGFALIKLSSAISDALALVESLQQTYADAASASMTAQAIFNLSPLESLLSDLNNLDPRSIAHSGMSLRLHTVQLEDGQLYVIDEAARLIGPNSAVDSSATEVDTINLINGVISSASIPGTFPPQVLVGPRHPDGGQKTWVDGGVRRYDPVQTAVELGATSIYAISTFRKAVDPWSMGGALPPPEWDASVPVPAQGGAAQVPTPLIRILNRATADILVDQVKQTNLTPPPAGWGVPMIRIAPGAVDIPGDMLIDPGLIRIAMAYGFMQAADAVTFIGLQTDPNVGPPPDKSAAYSFCSALSDQICINRYQIWVLENHLFATGDYNLLRHIHSMKLSILKYVASRISYGGSLPDPSHWGGKAPDPQNPWDYINTWWSQWEAHDPPVDQSIWATGPWDAGLLSVAENFLIDTGRPPGPIGTSPRPLKLRPPLSAFFIPEPELELRATIMPAIVTGSSGTNYSLALTDRLTGLPIPGWVQVGTNPPISSSGPSPFKIRVSYDPSHPSKWTIGANFYPTEQIDPLNPNGTVVIGSIGAGPGRTS